MATRVRREREDPGPWSTGSVVTIGAFDGVHGGHRRVLQLVRELADARGLDAVCVTFDEHPARVVRPDSAPRLLTDTEHLPLLEGLDLGGARVVDTDGEEWATLTGAAPRTTDGFDDRININPTWDISDLVL